MARYLVRAAGREYDIDVDYRQDGYHLKINGSETHVVCNELGDTRRLLLIDGRANEVDVRINGVQTGRTVFLHGVEVPVEIEDYHLAQLRKTAGMSAAAAVETVLRAPMPGLVIEVKVSPGEQVKKSQPLVIIEAMKMENILKAKSDATVKAIPVAAGNSVEKGDILVEFE
jgi:acetyl/propionyl-CoA carboxylase alpha subunit